MMRFLPRALALALAALLLASLTTRAQADILATNFFFGTVDRYNEQTGALVQAGFMVAPSSGPMDFAGLSGIAVHPTTKQVYVSGHENNRIYVFDGYTGQPVPAANTPSGIAGVFLQLPSGSVPAGLAFNANGDLYVASQSTLTPKVTAYNSAGAIVETVTSPLLNAPAGIMFDSSGNLFIANATPNGIAKYDGVNVTSAASVNGVTFGPYVPNGVLVDGSGQLYTADVFSNGVYKWDSTGTEVTGVSPFSPFIDIDADVPPPLSPPLTPFTDAPSGLLFDSNGDILVAAMGQTNPFFDGITSGAILRYDSATGALLQVLGTNLPPYTGLAFAPELELAAVPEPASVATFLLCGVALVAGARYTRFGRRRTPAERTAVR